MGPPGRGRCALSRPARDWSWSWMVMGPCCAAGGYPVCGTCTSHTTHWSKRVPRTSRKEVTQRKAYGHTPTTNRLGTLTHHLKRKRHPSSGPDIRSDNRKKTRRQVSWSRLAVTRKIVDAYRGSQWPPTPSLDSVYLSPVRAATEGPGLAACTEGEILPGDYDHPGF